MAIGDPPAKLRKAAKEIGAALEATTRWHVIAQTEDILGATMLVMDMDRPGEVVRLEFREPL